MTRGLMLDCARRYYSIGFLQNTINELSTHHYDQLHLHLSDNEAFRLESITVPAAVAAQHYTKAEMVSLVAYAAARRIMLVPEIDMPGHMGAILTGQYAGLGLTANNGKSLDLSKPGAYTLAQSLLAEYQILFPASCTHWVLGGDEWMVGGSEDSYPQLAAQALKQFGRRGTVWDLLNYFYNQMSTYLVTQGRVPHIWDDQLITPFTVVAPNKNIIIDVWYGNSSPAVLASYGYKLGNSDWNFIYAETDTDSYPTKRSLRRFTNTTYALNGGQSVVVPLANNAGVKMCVWSEQPDPYSEAQVASQLYPALQALAARCW
jgi:hexosaminidase